METDPKDHRDHRSKSVRNTCRCTHRRRRRRRSNVKAAGGGVAARHLLLPPGGRHALDAAAPQPRKPPLAPSSRRILVLLRSDKEHIHLNVHHLHLLVLFIGWRRKGNIDMLLAHKRRPDAAAVAAVAALATAVVS